LRHADLRLRRSQAHPAYMQAVKSVEGLLAALLAKPGPKATTHIVVVITTIIAIVSGHHRHHQHYCYRQRLHGLGEVGARRRAAEFTSLVILIQAALYVAMTSQSKRWLLFTLAPWCAPDNPNS
jgi:hypothetical protein